MKILDERGGETSVYITAGYYDEGSVGELFIAVGKQGSTLKGAFDSFAIMQSLALQYGVPVDAIINKFRYVAFEPSGKTLGDPRIKSCSSLIDYTMQWLELNKEIESCLTTAPPIAPPDPIEAATLEEDPLPDPS